MELEVSTLFEWIRRGPVTGNFEHSNEIYIYIPTNCTQLLCFINNTLKYLYCLKL